MSPIRAGTAVAVLLLALVPTACATIIQGTTQQVSLASSPSQAEITVNGQTSGRTPMVIDLARNQNHQIRVNLDGYQPYEITLSRSASGWILGNILFGGLIGLAVDAISGGMYKLSPEQVMAELREAGVADADVDDGLVFVGVVLEPDPTWERIGEMERVQVR